MSEAMHSVIRKFTAATLLIILLLAAASGRAAAACKCGYYDGRFTNYLGTTPGIAIDGDVTDWVAVLADTDNNVCDESDDRDLNILKGQDITRFAYTWDSNNVQVYTERSETETENNGVGDTKTGQNFIYYADKDNDGYMESGEPVIVAEWKGSNRSVTISVGKYVAQGADGADPMVDANGFGDGYTLPGTITGLVKYDEGKWGSSDGKAMEWQIPWSKLGITTPGSPFTFHISSTNSQPAAGSFPGQVEDNVGGCGGGAVSTQYAALNFTPSELSLQTGQGTTVYAAHTIENLGNGADTFNLASSVTGDFVPSQIAYYHDVDGSGTLTTGDTPLTDTDSDTIPDTGLLKAASADVTVNDTIHILIAYTVGADTGTAAVVTTATSAFQEQTLKSVTDTLTVILSPDLMLMKTVHSISDPVNNETNPKSIPGAVMRYTILVTNFGPGAVDDGTVVITDPIPDHTTLVLDANGSGPVQFQDGSPASGLTFAPDDVSFSNDGGSTYTYTPTPDANGCDAGVTHLKINPKGVFNGAVNNDAPWFEIYFMVRID